MANHQVLFVITRIEKFVQNNKRISRLKLIQQPKFYNNQGICVDHVARLLDCSSTSQLERKLAYICCKFTLWKTKKALFNSLRSWNSSDLDKTFM